MGKRIIIDADFSQNAIENIPHKLQVEQGYIDGDETNNQVVLYNESSTLFAKRVRTFELNGSYIITLNDGYVIKKATEYSPSLSGISPSSGSAAGSYTYTVNYIKNLVSGGTGTTLRYNGSYKTLVVVCKTDSNETISANEDVGTIQYL